MYEAILNHPAALFGPFERLRRELDDVFGTSGFSGGIRSVAAGSVPAINVGRTPTSVEVFAFAPGMDAAKIDVTLDRGVLRIAGERTASMPSGERTASTPSGERTASTPSGERTALTPSGERTASAGDARPQVYARERSTGRFLRAVSLPEDIDPSKVTATYRDGVLQVSIARRETVQPQRIAVQ